MKGKNAKEPANGSGLFQENSFGPLLSDLEVPEGAKKILRKYRRSSKEVRERLKSDLVLSYHFGGKSVACIQTKKGQAILAVGTTKDVSDALFALPRGEGRNVEIIFPEPWEEVYHDFTSVKPGSRRR